MRRDPGWKRRRIRLRASVSYASATRVSATAAPQKVKKMTQTSNRLLDEFAKLMTDAAGENFADLGANAVLPVSRALWQLAAALRRMPLAA